MRTWSDRPFPGAVRLAQVVAQQKVLGKDGGESRVVYEIAGYPGWVAKLYKEPLRAADASDLTDIIDLPAGMGPGDLAHVNLCTAWPTARIVEDHGDATVGVMMAMAPGRFLADFRLRGDRVSKDQPLTIDWLIGNDQKLVQHGIGRPTADLRRHIASEFLALGDLLDRHLVVYGDWSYRNCLWDPVNGEVFLLDMDSCRLHQRAWVESMEWEDPQSPVATRAPLSRYNDRYKLALLAARCITGERGNPQRALDALPPELRLGAFGSAVALTLTAAAEYDRSAPDVLYSALKAPVPAADGSHVTGFRPVRRAGASSTRSSENRVTVPANGWGASSPGSADQPAPPPPRSPADGQRTGTDARGATAPAGQRLWTSGPACEPGRRAAGSGGRYGHGPSATRPGENGSGLIRPGLVTPARVVAAAVALLILLIIVILVVVL